MADRRLPTPEEVRQLLDYDPKTGTFTWRARSVEVFQRAETPNPSLVCALWNGRRAGQKALTAQQKHGYLFGSLFGTKIYAHRAAWAHYHGEWPEKVDHINGDPSDNRISNLRSVSHDENMKNVRRHADNKSGFLGVSFCKQTRRWRASITANGKSINLGRFTTKEEAVSARREADRAYGFHFNHGRHPSTKPAPQGRGGS